MLLPAESTDTPFMKEFNYQQMRLTRAILSFLILVLVLQFGPQSASAQDANEDQASTRTLALQKVLEAGGLSRGRLQPDPFALITSATASDRLPLLRQLSADPLSIPYRVGMLKGRFKDRQDSIHRLFLYAASPLGVGVSRGYIGHPFRSIDNILLDAEDPLRKAFEDMEKEFGDFDIDAELDRAADLQGTFRFEVARLIAVIMEAEMFRRRAFRDIPQDLDSQKMYEQILLSRFRDFQGPDFRLYIHDVEYEALVSGMLDLTLAIEDFQYSLENNYNDLQEIYVRFTLPLGEVIVDTRLEDSIHSSDKPLLVIDTKGDDDYFPNDKRNARTGISVVYDYTGNDRHWSEPGKGASAIFGYGITWDREGNDRYDGDHLSQASTFFGMAMHIDLEGEDNYQAIAYSQAFALGGVSLLFDKGGGDEYTSVIRSQASAGPKGSAVLIENGGNTTYSLLNFPLIDPSAQSTEHNVSMGQGAATGFRGDLIDGRSLSGGVALLYDEEGDDVYTAQVFSQGCGFLEGTGILIDDSGKDTYQGVWYTQGSAAHSAVGVLLDLGEGDDTHHAEMYTSLGCGHDYSVGVLLNESGDENYHVRNLGLGAGNDNGIGILADLSGNDSYEIHDKDSYGLGAARITKWGSSRESYNGIGLFFDLGGTDQYVTQRSAANNDDLWRWPRKYPELDLSSEIGVGIDGTYENPFYLGARTDAEDSDDKRVLQRANQQRREYQEKIYTSTSQN